MNLTNEVLEMWEEEARGLSQNATSAKAHFLHLLAEHRKTVDLLRTAHGRLMAVDPEWRERALADV